MAESALKALANATAVFDLATAGTITDPLTGNVLPNSEQVSVELYLRQSGPDPQGLPGVESDADRFEGYAVNPAALDARVTTGTRGTLTFSGDSAAPCTVVACRGPYGTTGLLGSTLQGILGDRIRVTRYRQA